MKSVAAAGLLAANSLGDVRHWKAELLFFFIQLLWRKQATTGYKVKLNNPNSEIRRFFYSLNVSDNMKELSREVGVQRKDDIAIRQVLLKKKGAMMEGKDFEVGEIWLQIPIAISVINESSLTEHPPL